MNPAQLLRLAFVASVACALCTSCAEFDALNAKGKAQSDKTKTAVAAGRHAEPAYWHGDDGTGEPRIVVNLTEQRAFFYKGKKVVGESNISTGRKGFDTPPGKYRVIFKLADMAMEIEHARIFLYKACWLRDQKKPFGKESAMAKLYCSEVAQEVANEIISAGILAILNFAPIILQAPDHVVVNNVNLAIELENLSYFIK